MTGLNYVIEAKGEIPYFVKTNDGCELLSDDRNLKIIIKHRKVFNNNNNTQQEVCTTACWVASHSIWERGNISYTICSIDEYIKSLDASSYFTKATNEYRQYLNTDIK